MHKKIEDLIAKNADSVNRLIALDESITAIAAALETHSELEGSISLGYSTYGIQVDVALQVDSLRQTVGLFRSFARAGIRIDPKSQPYDGSYGRSYSLWMPSAQLNADDSPKRERLNVIAYVRKEDTANCHYVKVGEHVVEDFEWKCDDDSAESAE